MRVASLTLLCLLGCKSDSSQEATARGTRARMHLTSISSAEAVPGDGTDADEQGFVADV